MSKKQTILTSTDKELMLSKSAYVLPDNPSSKQMSASQIRKKLYEAYIVLFDWLSRAITENNENVDLNDTQITTILENISALQGYFTDDKARKAIADEDGNTIKVTYGSSLEGSLITEDGNQKVYFYVMNKSCVEVLCDSGLWVFLFGGVL